MDGRKVWKTAEKRSIKRKSGLETQLYVFEKESFRDLQDLDHIHFETSSSPSPTLRNYSSSSPSRSLLCSRLSQKPETFHYEIISVAEGKQENSDEEESEVTEISEFQDKTEDVSSPYVSLKSELVKRKFSLNVETGWRDLESREFMRPKFPFKSNSRYCNRALIMKNSDIPKHFCDVFGPGMCKDCMKARKKQANIEDFGESFPDITISPFSLCVVQESPDGKVKTLPNVYKDCDPLFRRRRAKGFSHGPCVPATRPNSSVSRESCSLSLEASSPVLLTSSSSSEFQRRTETPSSSRPPSRPSSLPQYSESRNDEQRRLESLPENCSENGMKFREVRAIKSVKVMPQSAKTRRGPKPIREIHPSDLQQNVFHKAISARTSGTSSRTPAFERRGKLSELPYWKFMIPQPPIMEVGRMNVSIYTPKDIPGIKIFDESLFDI